MMETDDKNEGGRVTRARARSLSVADSDSRPSTPLMDFAPDRVGSPRTTRRNTRLNTVEAGTPAKTRRSSLARGETPEPASPISAIKRSAKNERTPSLKSARKLLHENITEESEDQDMDTISNVESNVSKSVAKQPTSTRKSTRSTVARGETPDPSTPISAVKRSAKQERTPALKSARKLLPEAINEEIEDQNMEIDTETNVDGSITQQSTLTGKITRSTATRGKTPEPSTPAKNDRNLDIKSAGNQLQNDINEETEDQNMASLTNAMTNAGESVVKQNKQVQEEITDETEKRTHSPLSNIGGTETSDLPSNQKSENKLVEENIIKPSDQIVGIEAESNQQTLILTPTAEGSAKTTRSFIAAANEGFIEKNTDLCNNSIHGITYMPNELNARRILAGKESRGSLDAEKRMTRSCSSSPRPLEVTKSPMHLNREADATEKETPLSINAASIALEPTTPELSKENVKIDPLTEPSANSNIKKDIDSDFQAVTQTNSQTDLTIASNVDSCPVVLAQAETENVNTAPALSSKLESINDEQEISQIKSNDVLKLVGMQQEYPHVIQAIDLPALTPNIKRRLITADQEIKKSVEFNNNIAANDEPKPKYPKTPMRIMTAPVGLDNVQPQVESPYKYVKQQARTSSTPIPKTDKSINGLQPAPAKMDSIKPLEDVTTSFAEESVANLSLSKIVPQRALAQRLLSDDESDEHEDEYYELENDEKNEFIDDEAEEVNDYASGDSMASSERREIENNEIPDDGESLNSRDTTEDDEEEGEIGSNMSFIVSDEDSIEEVEISSSKKRRRIVVEDSSDSEVEVVHQILSSQKITQHSSNSSKSADAIQSLIDTDAEFSEDEQELESSRRAALRELSKSDRFNKTASALDVSPTEEESPDKAASKDNLDSQMPTLVVDSSSEEQENYRDLKSVASKNKMTVNKTVYSILDTDDEIEKADIQNVAEKNISKVKQALSSGSSDLDSQDVNVTQKRRKSLDVNNGNEGNADIQNEELKLSAQKRMSKARRSSCAQFTPEEDTGSEDGYAQESRKSVNAMDDIEEDAGVQNESMNKSSMEVKDFRAKSFSPEDYESQKATVPRRTKSLGPRITGKEETGIQKGVLSKTFSGTSSIAHKKTEVENNCFAQNGGPRTPFSSAKANNSSTQFVTSSSEDETSSPKSLNNDVSKVTKSTGKSTEAFHKKQKHDDEQALLSELPTCDLTHLQKLFNPLQKSRRQTLYVQSPDEVATKQPKLKRRSEVLNSNDFNPSQSFIETLAENQRQQSKRKRLSKSFCVAADELDIDNDASAQAQPDHKKMKKSHDEVESESASEVDEPMQEQQESAQGISGSLAASANSTEIDPKKNSSYMDYCDGIMQPTDHTPVQNQDQKAKMEPNEEPRTSSSKVTDQPDQHKATLTEDQQALATAIRESMEMSAAARTGKNVHSSKTLSNTNDPVHKQPKTSPNNDQQPLSEAIKDAMAKSAAIRAGKHLKPQEKAPSKPQPKNCDYYLDYCESVLQAANQAKLKQKRQEVAAGKKKGKPKTLPVEDNVLVEPKQANEVAMKSAKLKKDVKRLQAAQQAVKQSIKLLAPKHNQPQSLARKLSPQVEIVTRKTEKPMKVKKTKKAKDVTPSPVKNYYEDKNRSPVIELIKTSAGIVTVTAATPQKKKFVKHKTGLICVEPCTPTNKYFRKLSQSPEPFRRRGQVPSKVEKKV
ncbi:protein slender lobes [Scaptodrosophila lebanonensis]|uniref:Protein slender lobes n=1 Tax=Drosophila lebanonensis TaxID=7225 RepID=A0A6J2T233_DROLE|nr:protein slender lobes [Scaptodrosophila lebanonensis]